MCHFVLPGKNAVVQPPLENFQIRQTMCDTLFVRFLINDQVTMNPPVLVTILKLRVLGLHVIYILCYVMRSKEHNRIKILEIKSNLYMPCWLPSSKEQTFSNSNSTKNLLDKEPLCKCAIPTSCYFYYLWFLWKCIRSVWRIASLQTSFGVCSSRVHFTPTGQKWMHDKQTSKDVCGKRHLERLSGEFVRGYWDFKG